MRTEGTDIAMYQKQMLSIVKQNNAFDEDIMPCCTEVRPALYRKQFLVYRNAGAFCNVVLDTLCLAALKDGQHCTKRRHSLLKCMKIVKVVLQTLGSAAL